MIDQFLFSSVIVVLAILLISLFWKISLHMAGLGGISGLILMLSLIYTLDMTFYLSVLFLISGIVASARLVLKEHNLLQIATGYFTGFLIVGIFLLQLVH